MNKIRFIEALRGGCADPHSAAVYAKDSPSPPPPPDYSGIASSNAESAKMAKDSADADLAFRKQVYTENKPRQQQLADMATQVANQQMGLAQSSEDRSNEQWQSYKNTYAPNELQTAADAYGQQFLSKDEADQMSRVLSGEAGVSGGEAQRQLQDFSRTAEGRAAEQAVEKSDAQINSSYGQQARGLQRMGGDPNKIAAAAAQMAQSQAATRVGAANTARENVRGQGVALRSGVANFGRNMPNTAGQAVGLAATSGNSAVSNQGAALTAGLPYAQFQAGGYGSGIAAAGVRQQGALGLGNIMNGGYGTQGSIYGAQSAANTAANNQTMEVIGTAASAAMMFF